MVWEMVVWYIILNMPHGMDKCSLICMLVAHIYESVSVALGIVKRVSVLLYQGLSYVAGALIAEHFVWIFYNGMSLVPSFKALKIY